MLVVCALAAAWVAAGSVGLLAHPLRRILAGLFLLAGVVAVLPPTSVLGPGWGKRWVWLLAAAALLAAPFPVVNVLAPAVVLGAAALAAVPVANRRLLEAGAQAVLVFALYLFAVTLVPWGWLAGDHLARLLGRVVSLLSPWPLEVGRTYAGLDFLVLSTAFCTRLARESGRRGFRLWGALALSVGGAHLAYLLAVAAFPRWRDWLPTLVIPPRVPGLEPTTKSIAEAVLWQLPWLGLVFHLPLNGWWAWRLSRTGANDSPGATPGPAGAPPPSRELWNRWAWVALLLAVAVPVIMLLNPRPLSLKGRKIVVYEKGFLNWLKPRHGEYGRLSVGMYGMWPAFCASYGAQCVISPDLSEADLAGADLLVLIFPNRPWEPGQLERIHRYVAGGGTLLVLGEHTVREKDGGNRFNEALGPTAMQVAFDSAMFAVGGWLHSYQALAHPAALGIRDDRNQFGVVIGASIEATWPARPLLVGRWGWADPGDVTNDETRGGSMMGNQKYDAGERLGDVLLAAEQRWGRGRVVVFGDTSGFTNGILVGSHQYVAALLAALCQKAEFGPGRMLAALAGCLLLAGWVWRQRWPGWVLGVSLVFGAATWGASAWSAARANLVPDGRGAQPNNLAYLDTTHAERVSGESWRPNGLGGLQLTLMRNGYLVLNLPEFTDRRLEGAGLLVCAAPGRPFTARERAVARRFVERGGILIFTVGWPEAAASRPVLADLGFYVGGRGAAEGHGPEPKPFGHFKAPYYNGGDYMAYVRFHAAWAVESSDPNAQPLAYGPRDPLTGRDPTVILMRRLGRGKVVVVADSEFATNQNLENEGGQPFEGLRENADFWRWLLSYLNDQPVWTPPRPVPEKPAVPATGAPAGAPPAGQSPAGAAPAEGPLPGGAAP